MQNPKYQVFKPKRPIISDNLQRPISFHPLVILEDDDEKIYYLKVVSYAPHIKSFTNDVRLFVEDIKKPQNVIIKDSLIDCTKIYMMQKTDFLNYYQQNHLKIGDLFLTKVWKIYRSLKSNLNYEPPFIGLIEVIKHPDNLSVAFNTWYSHETLLKNDLNNVLADPDIDNDTIDKYKDLYNDILHRRNQNIDTIDFIDNLRYWTQEKIEEVLLQLKDLEKKSVKEKEEY